MSDTLTTAEVMARAGFRTRAAVSVAVKAGKLRPLGRNRFSAADVDRYLAERTASPFHAPGTYEHPRSERIQGRVSPDVLAWLESHGANIGDAVEAAVRAHMEHRNLP